MTLQSCFICKRDIVHCATPAVKRAQSGLLTFDVDNKKFFQQQQLLQQQHSYSN